MCISINSKKPLQFKNSQQNKTSLLMAERYEVDIMGNVDMPLSHQNITNLDIKVLNKLLSKEGFTSEEKSHIKETRRRSKMKEYSRKRRQQEMEEIEFLESTKAALERDYEKIIQEINFLKKKKTTFGLY